MSILEDNWNLEQQAQEFFVYTTLGIVPKKIFKDGNYNKTLSQYNCLDNIDINNIDINYKVYCIFKCARAAYNDLSRTLRYQEAYKSSSKNKKALEEKENKINCVCATLTRAIYNDGNTFADAEELFKELVEGDNPQECLSDLFKCLSEDKKTNQKFHFGQVQKWVNMTLKYLYLLGIVKDEDDVKALHIPIDSYIMKALTENEIKFPKQSGDYGSYSDSNSVKWSRLNEDEYKKIVEEYRKTSSIGKNPIMWEHNAWIKQAEKEKGIEITEK